jgi:hypothetical protein
MYSFGEEMVIGGDITAIWQAATDVDAWPSWDPHEEKAVRADMRLTFRALETEARRREQARA